MPAFHQNPHRGTGLPALNLLPADDARPVQQLLLNCPAHKPTPLIDAQSLATELGIGHLWIKDERQRMGLGSFKALGAAYAIARDAAEAKVGNDWETALNGRCYVTASAGNHGLSLAAGARLFGARAIVYLAETVPEAFAERLRAIGSEVRRAGSTYEDSMDAAATDATANGWTLLSDSSWPGYTDMPFRVMEGYLQLAAEAAEQIDTPPTHILLQAGVGGLAAAVTAYARKIWGDAPTIVIVEPEAAPALRDSIQAGAVVTSQGPVSTMGRLDCKTPSMIALAGLARDADTFTTISEEEVARCVERLADNGLATTPSGGAGLALLMSGFPGLTSESRVLTILSEGPEDA